MKNYLNHKQLDILLELPEYIEFFHQTNFKMVDFVHNDIYRNMNDAGLFDYNYIERGQRASKGQAHRPSKTNLVYLFWLMIVMELKEFGFVKSKLFKVKDYLFKEFDILDTMAIATDKDSLLTELEKFNFKSSELKETLRQKITSGSFLNAIKDKSVSRMFLTIMKMLSTGRDIQLYIDSSAEALFVDEFEISDAELKRLTYDSRLILPLKKYLLFFVGEYAPEDFLVRSKILTEREVFLLQEFKRNDILSFSVKFHKGKPHLYESKKLEKYQLQARLSDVLIGGGYEDIILKTKQGSIYYSEINTKTKL